MSDSRRRLLLSFAGAAGVLAVEPLLAVLQVPNHPAPQPRPSPYTPNGNYPPGLQGPRPKEPDQKAIDRANQKELRDEVSELFDRVTELKDQIDKTDATATRSISVVKKAQQIEKLAKQIKDLAKG